MSKTKTATKSPTRLAKETVKADPSPKQKAEENSAMDKAKCRFVARTMAKRFDHFPKGTDELRIVFAFALGLMMVNAGAKPLRVRGKNQDEETLVSSVILAADNGASILEEYFYMVLTRSSSTPEDLLLRFDATWDEIRSVRRFRGLLKESVKDERLTERPGRPTKITQNDWQELLRQSSALLPLCIELLRFRRTARKRSVSELLTFLKLDYPNEVPFLMGHLPKVEAVMKDHNLLANIKTARTRANKLADIFAGFAFDLRPQYAMQQALTARRNSIANDKSEEN
jgi:hypothetical protein